MHSEDILSLVDKFESKYNDLDVLNEALTLNNYGIVVTGNGKSDRGFANDPYFKFYKGNNIDHCGEKLVRISIYRPEFIQHYKDSKQWKIKRADIDKLMILLQSEPDKIYMYGDNKICNTNWEVVLYLIAQVITMYTNKAPDYSIMNTPMPDYYRLL